MKILLLFHFNGEEHSQGSWWLQNTDLSTLNGKGIYLKDLDWQMYKQNVVYSCSEILCGNKKGTDNGYIHQINF